MTNEPKPPAGDPPKWAMEAANKLARCCFASMSTEEVARIIAAAVPDEGAKARAYDMIRGHLPPEKCELLAKWFDADDAEKGGGRGCEVQIALRCVRDIMETTR